MCVRPGDPAAEKVDGWRSRLAALETKRSVIEAAYTGRERGKQLKVVDRQVDALLQEFLELTDATIGG